jgi:nucleoside 2-deoxyribosyltransferase
MAHAALVNIYLIGSLRNPVVPEIAEALRERGFTVFDDWYAAGPEADDYWQRYEQYRGRSYGEALDGYAANNVYQFDRSHLDRADAGVLVMPAGRSGHLELGYIKGKGKRAYVLFDKEPERWDVMYRFADKVLFGRDQLVAALVNSQGM